MDYLTISKTEKQQMLNDIGVDSVKDLFKDIPEQVCIDNIDIEPGKTEYETETEFNRIINKNKNYKIFAGYGVYNHYIPSIINHIVMRNEFFTAYTPYQPEISQGILKIIFEFQTNISRLTGMDISNASLYDGASACAESILMAGRLTKSKTKTLVLLHKNINNRYIQVIKNYIKNTGYTIKFIDDTESSKQLFENAVCVLLQYPDCLGRINHYKNIVELSKQNNCLVIFNVYPMVCSILKTPGELKADICCGELQCFGIPMNCGGSYLGFITCKTEFARQIPGRVVGQTQDKNNNNAYVLTLQTREQHIRRERATSNICSNQSLNVLKTNVYMSLLGYKGLKHLSKQIYNLTHYFYDKLNKETENVLIKTDKDFFNEFLIKVKQPDKFIEFMLEKHNIFPGILVDYNNEQCVLLAVTEKNNIIDFDNYIKGLKEWLNKNPNL